MAMTGLEVFDKTLHTTNLWLDEINAEIGPDRHLAWHVLGAVLRSIRDEMQVEQSAHFAAQLPLLIRGAYFDQYRPAVQPALARSQEDFLSRVQRELDGSRPVKVELAAAAVMRTLNRHVTEGQVRKVRDALSKSVRAMWPEPEHKEPEHARSDPQKSDQSPKDPEPPRSAGQPASGRQPAPPQDSEPQHAASRPATAPHAAPPPSPQHAAPPPSPQHAAPPPSPQHAAPPPSPQHAAPPPSPQHAAPPPSPQRVPSPPTVQASSAPQRAEPQHLAPQGSAHGRWEDIDAEEETSFLAKSPSSAHVPIGTASRPAKIHAAPAAERTATSARKPKTQGKRKDD
jgi:uncharacterized protein (DUF2267 family)